MAHAQKPDFVFRRNGWAHLSQWGRQFSRLLAADVSPSAVVMLDTPCSEVVWRVLATHSIRQFPLHFPSRASSCAITFQLESTSSADQSKNMKYVTVHWLPLEVALSIFKFNLFCLKKTILRRNQWKQSRWPSISNQQLFKNVYLEIIHSVVQQITMS